MGWEPRIVTVGQDRDKILSIVKLDGAVPVSNLETDLGPIGSVAAGLKEINHSVDAAVVWPVDQPHVVRATLEELVRSFERSRPRLVVPSYEGRGGHPIVLSSAVFAECLAAASGRLTLRDVVRTDAARVLRVPVSDRAVVQDIDTPEDYATLIAST